MPIEQRDWITEEMMKAEPDTLFVFGDNIERWGKKGQALVMRGKPNAVGIPTKKAPKRDDEAYFTDSDEDLALFKSSSLNDWLKLAKHLIEGKVVVIPSAGIGTDLAQLWKRSPRIAEYMHRCFDRLLEVSNKSYPEKQKEANRKRLIDRIERDK